MKAIFLMPLSLLLLSCLGMPAGMKPVEGFELERYLGTWYEIARLDHSFESGMQNVTAEYSLRDDGGVKVRNRGYKLEKNKWKQATGKAYFVDATDTAYLKVSFFGPFYGSYVIFELDKDNYQYAFVSGPDHSYLWFLSRTPTVEPALMDKFIKHASEAGFNTDELIYVSHDARESGEARDKP